MTRRRGVAVVGDNQAEVAAIADTFAGRYDVLRLTISGGRWQLGPRVLGVRPATSLARALALLADVDVILPVSCDAAAVAALGHLAGVPCAGSPVRAHALAGDRELLNLIAGSADVATPTGVVVDRLGARGLDYLDPVTVRAAEGRAAYDGVVVTDLPQLRRALDTVLAGSRRALVEEPVFGERAEVVVAETADDRPLVLPTVGAGRWSAMESNALASAARRLWTALGCRGVASMTFHLTWEGPILDGVDLAPRLGPADQVPVRLRDAGITHRQLLHALVSLACPSDTMPIPHPPLAIQAALV